MNPLITNLAFFAAGFGRYSASRTPAIAYSVNDCVVTNSIHGSPVRYAEAQAIVFKKYVLSSASGIFRSGCCNKSPVPDASVIYRFGHFVTSKLLTVKDAWRSAVRQIFGSYPSQAEGNFNTITLCMTVVNFHRGSSMRSQSKDATIANLSASK